MRLSLTGPGGFHIEATWLAFPMSVTLTLGTLMSSALPQFRPRLKGRGGMPTEATRIARDRDGQDVGTGCNPTSRKVSISPLPFTAMGLLGVKENSLPRVWPLLGGGIGLAAQASDLFGWQLPITEERIQREINRSN